MRNQSLRSKGKKKNGGQPGHKGGTLLQSSTPDIIQKYELSTCPSCENSLAGVSAIGVVKRQVFDIPAPKIMVTEHRGEIKVCPICQKRSTACFPPNVQAPIQYGIGIQTWAVYLHYNQLIPEKRLQQTFMDLVQLPLSGGSIRTFSSSLFDQLKGVEEHVLDKIKKATVKNLDETGFRVSGATQWLHVASTPAYTYYHISAKRKSLLEGLEGIVVPDHWKAYYQLKGLEHSLCNQHHLRELKSLIDYEKEVWAKQMDRFLRFSVRYVHAYGEKNIPGDKLVRLREWYEQIVEKGILYHEQLPPLCKPPGRGRQARRTGHNLVLRLKNYSEDVLRFLYNRVVPFTNNQAERDLRMMKCKQKISGGFRAQEGAVIFARIRGYISTARKQGLNIFEAIQLALQGLPYSFS